MTTTMNNNKQYCVGLSSGCLFLSILSVQTPGYVFNCSSSVKQDISKDIIPPHVGIHSASVDLLGRMHDDDFRIVKNKKNRRKKSYLITITRDSSVSNTENHHLDDQLKQRLQGIESEITCEPFYRVLVDILLKRKSVDRIVCLGLGHYSDCPTSRVQLGFLLALTKSIKPANVQLQDPAFSGPEIAFLESLKFEVLPDNVEGKFSTERDETVLYYLPHCPKLLTNNLLWCNWQAQKLENSILICNSFQALLENSLDRDIEAEAGYVRRIAEFTTEIPLKVSERHFDSFNDTSIHLFDRQDLNKIVDTAFWTDNRQPKTVAPDLEIVSKRLETALNI